MTVLIHKLQWNVEFKMTHVFNPFYICLFESTLKQPRRCGIARIIKRAIARDWIALLMLTLLKSQAFAIHTLLYGKVEKWSRLHFLGATFWKFTFFVIMTQFVNGFRFIGIVKQQFLDRLWALLADFLTLVSNSINIFKKYSIYSTFCLHFGQLAYICGWMVTWVTS